MTTKIKTWTIVTLLASSSLTIMSSATIAPSLPQISEVFANAPYADVLSRLILTIPGLTIALTAPFAGYFIDRAGRKNFIIAGLILYGITGSAGLYLDSLSYLLASRALLGLAVAAVMTSCTTLIGDYFAGEQRNRIIGMQSSSMALGGVVFIILGGLLADYSWRGPFSLYLIALALVIPAILFIDEPSRKPVPGHQPDSGAPRHLSIFSAILIHITGFAGMMFFYMVPVQIPFLLKEFEAVSNTKVGIAIASSTLIGAIVSSFYQKIKHRFLFPTIYAFTFCLMACGFWLIGIADSYITTVAGLLVNGLGMGMMMPNGSSWIMAITPLHMRGRIVGTLTTAVFLGQFCSPIISQPLTAKTGINNTFLLCSYMTLVIGILFAISARRLHKTSIKELT